MKRLIYCFLFIIALYSISFSRTKVSDYARKGGKSVRTSSTTLYNLMETYPNCTITIYKKGTTTLASIYTNESGTIKANPFTAGSDASYSFYIDLKRYDIKFSGTGIATPFTLSDKFVNDSNDLFDVISFGAKCDNSTIDTIAISNAITAAALVDGSIIISRGTCRTQSVTFPSNIELDMKQGGILYPITGQTITINSNIAANNSQHFSNATIGLGTIDFTSNTIVKTLYTDWWGFNSTDDKPQINAAIASMPFGSKMKFSSKNYKHSGWSLDHKAQITIEGNESLDGYIDPSWGTVFTYIGVDGGNAITINNCYSCTFRGFMSKGADINTIPGTTGATRNLYITMTAGGNPPLSSQNVFQSLDIQAGNTRTDQILVDIDNASGTNNEFQRFRDCKLIGGTGSQVFNASLGIGIRLGHANVKQIFISGTTFLTLAIGIDSHSGSFRGIGNSWSHVHTIYYGTFSDAIEVVGDDSEACTQILQDGPSGNGIPFTFTGCRWDAIRGAAPANSSERSILPVFNYGSKLNIIGSTITAWPEIDNQNFTSKFLDGTGVDEVSAIGSLEWFNSFAGKNGAEPIPEINFNQALSSFLSSHVLGTSKTVLGSNTNNQNSYAGISLTGNKIDLIGVQRTKNMDVGDIAEVDSIVVGSGAAIEIIELARPQRPDYLTIGANDFGLNLTIAIIAMNSMNHRTMPSLIREGILGNTTLSVSNYVKLTWPKIKGATNYLVLQFASGAWRLIDTVAASGIDTETYNIVANPAGAYTYTLPTFNETTRIKFRGPLAPVSTLFANLAIPTPANGDIRYCPDCTIANPCAGSGTGAFAKRLNNIWVCN